MTHNTKILLDGLMFPEGPRWHAEKLWFSDMQGLHVMTVDLGGNAEKIVEIKASPSGLGWLPDGRLLVVSMIDRRLLLAILEACVEGDAARGLEACARVAESGAANGRATKAQAGVGLKPWSRRTTARRLGESVRR